MRVLLRVGMLAIGVSVLTIVKQQHEAVSSFVDEARVDDWQVHLPGSIRHPVANKRGPSFPTWNANNDTVISTALSVNRNHSSSPSQTEAFPPIKQKVATVQQNLTKRLADIVYIGDCITWKKDRSPKLGLRWTLHHSSGFHLPTGGNLSAQDETQQHDEPTHRIHQLFANVQDPRSFPQDLSVVMYGSSHQTWTTKKLEPSIMQFGSGIPRNLTRCDPDRTGYVQGKYGIDLENCGLPDKVMDTVLVNGTTTLARGFKTFLHTPEADLVFAAFLKEHHMERPVAVIVDVGVWGTRGHRVTDHLNYTLTPGEEFDYYFDWLDTTFFPSKLSSTATRMLLVLEDKKYYDRVCDMYRNDTDDESSFGDLVHRRVFQYAASNPNVNLLRKDKLTKSKPKGMVCRHGCGGPIMTIVASLTLDWLDEIARLS